MTVRNVSKSAAIGTHYEMFEARREQKTGEDGQYDTHLGISPMSRWLAFAFDYADFDVDNQVQVVLPENTIALKCMARVDLAFAGAATANIGDAADPDGWGAALSLATTGVRYGAAAAYNAAGATLYATGGPLIVTANADPTAGRMIVLMEVISYCEALEAEWS